MEAVAVNDWINTNPVFYHEKTGKYSHRLADVIDFDSFDWDWVGLRVYLRFGYCALGLTPIRQVRFVEACQELVRSKEGRLIARDLPDTALDLLEGPRTTPEEVLAMLRQQIENYLAGAERVSIPLTAGYDSRLLASLVPPQVQAQNFTFGTTLKPEQDREVLYARWISDQLGQAWQHVPIQDYWAYATQAFPLFSLECNLSYLHYYRFQQQIHSQGGRGKSLSGLVGDAFAGKFQVPRPRHAAEIDLLTLTHGIHADDTQLRQPRAPYEQVVEDYLHRNSDLLAHPQGRIVALMRNKMMLLKFLTQLPVEMGSTCLAPYVQPQVAAAMMRLPEAERRDRLWQRQYFEQRGLIPNRAIRFQKTNLVQQQAWIHKPGIPLQAELLREILPERYVARVWQGMPKRLGTPEKSYHYWMYRLSGHIPAIKKRYFNNSVSHYYTLLPLQLMIQARNQNVGRG